MYMIFRFNVMYVYLSKDGSKALSYIIIKKIYVVNKVKCFICLHV